MTNKRYLAVDLGASSGRVLSGAFDGGRLKIEEVHRFPNGPSALPGGLFWNALGLFSEIKAGLAKAAARDGAVASVGVDTWGVDYGLLDAQDQLLGNPHQYRDPRTDGMQEEAFRRLPKERIYDATGIQFMFFNTAFQLLSEVVRRRPTLDIAHRLLFMPDLFHFWLSGVKANERTIASTSQLLDARTRGWSDDVILGLGLPRRLFGELVDAGTVLGGLTASVREETGLGDVQVVAVGAHDTASAVAAVPARGDRYAYLSSGTWSLMGIETPAPVITPASFRHGFTNEGGVCGTTRVLKNICGLWLLQECRRVWTAQGMKISFDEMEEAAAQAPAFASLIDPDDASFATPGDMPTRIQAFCRRTGQPVPEGVGPIVRTVMESLALKYRSVFGKLEEMAGHRLDTLHLVGGGIRHRALNQFAANAVQRPVVTGPVEATAAGNLLLQMMAAGDLASLAEGREVIARSFETETFAPRDAGAWEEAARSFARVET